MSMSKSKFVKIPAFLLSRPDFTPNALKLYGLLSCYANANSVEFPGQTDLCKELGVSERTLRRSLRELENIGLVRFRRRGNGANGVYQMILSGVNE